MPPYQVDLVCRSENVSDLMHFTDYLLVTGDLERALVKAGICGYELLGEAHIASIRPRTLKEKIDDLHVLKVKPVKGVIDFEVSSILLEGSGKRCSECLLGGNLLKIDTLAFLQGTEKLHDVFIGQGLPGVTFVSESFKAACSDFDSSAVSFIKASEFRLDFTSSVPSSN